MTLFNLFYWITYKAGWAFRVPDDLSSRGGGDILKRIRHEFLQHEAHFAGIPFPGDEMFFVRRDDSRLTVQEALEIFLRYGVRAEFVPGKQVNWTIGGFGRPKHRWL
jgi:hypothetical protein